MVNMEEEERLRSKDYLRVAGIDESGVGCFAGDVYAAAVILPHDFDYRTHLPGLNDSKKISADRRNVLYNKIKDWALAWGVGTASVEEIDDINIYWAKMLAMRRAIRALKIEPDYVIVDGNKEIPKIEIPQHAIVKGDQKSISIAAASVLAKVDRDRHIEKLSSLVHPDFDWDNNKSYYSAKHVRAIKRHGKTIWHREKYVRKYLGVDNHGAHQKI